MGSLFPSSTFPLSYASDDMWKQPESNRCLLMSQSVTFTASAIFMNSYCKFWCTVRSQYTYPILPKKQHNFHQTGPFTNWSFCMWPASFIICDHTVLLLTGACSFHSRGCCAPEMPPHGKNFIPEKCTVLDPIEVCVKFQLSRSNSLRDITGSQIYIRGAAPLTRPWSGKIFIPE